MGNSLSEFQIENDFIASPNQCENLSNDSIAYITKQYITILKASSILDALIFSKQTIDISKPELLTINTNKVLADLLCKKPLKQTITIFEPIQKPTGKFVNGISETKYYTVLDQYNDFFLHQYNVFTNDSDRINKAKIIKTNLDICVKNALCVLNNSCNDIGKTQIEVIKQNSPTEDPKDQEETLV